MLLKCSKINDPDGSYFIKASCGNYLSYVADCNNAATVDLWYQPTYNQKFKFTAANSAQNQLYIEAVGRASVIVIKLFPSKTSWGICFFLQIWPTIYVVFQKLGQSIYF
jgi:hypothetical protein